ncbi:hypothetical protein T440DRAFT_41412 [Plenodomus tracheiphilus IPT5]|uniref:Uncharacterized protein n=1 Tax=Plenodomus tracheiphilus IPT5 TaxID=1408161 RepID=A0A6A7BAS3_9PLEO|nr:hypothetical protein T440DRAFT_41412 [Plenodomus tracheiphilus IPT5]
MRHGHMSPKGFDKSFSTLATRSAVARLTCPENVLAAAVLTGSIFTLQVASAKNAQTSRCSAGLKPSPQSIRAIAYPRCLDVPR